jgi:hypothetical protein
MDEKETGFPRRRKNIDWRYFKTEGREYLKSPKRKWQKRSEEIIY